MIVVLVVGLDALLQVIDVNVVFSVALLVRLLLDRVSLVDLVEFIILNFLIMNSFDEP